KGAAADDFAAAAAVGPVAAAESVAAARAARAAIARIAACATAATGTARTARTARAARAARATRAPAATTAAAETKRCRDVGDRAEPVILEILAGGGGAGMNRILRAHRNGVLHAGNQERLHLSIAVHLVHRLADHVGRRRRFCHAGDVGPLLDHLAEI